MIYFQSVSPGSSGMSFNSISSSKIFTSFTKYHTPTSNNVPIVTNAGKKKYHNDNKINDLRKIIIDILSDLLLFLHI